MKTQSDRLDISIIDRYSSQRGTSLGELSERSPLLIVFLRHLGCTFCREALADVARQRQKIESNGVKIVLVHMGEELPAKELFSQFELEDVDRISDPEQELYRAFELKRGSLLQLLGPKVWLRGFKAGILKGHGVGKLMGDGFQMPGAFVVHDRKIVTSFRHHTAADRPDYTELASCQIPAAQVDG